MSIWDNPQLARFNTIPSIRLSLNEGNTPFYRAMYDNTKVVIKNEMVNPNNSFKDRSLCYQLSHYLAKGIVKFVISSSGNAAISAASYIASHGESEIDIFIGNQITDGKKEKLTALASDKIRIHQGQKPKSDAIKFSKETIALNLRGSIDDVALTGFKTIAYEIAEETPDIDCLFLPTSSGTSALGLHYGFEEMGLKVAIFICQSQKVHPIAEEFDKDFESQKDSIADAIVDKVALRKSKLVQVLKQNKGGGLVLSDFNIFHAQAKTGLANIFMPSYNSALAFAGLSKALKLPDFNYKMPLILVSGI